MAYMSPNMVQSECFLIQLLHLVNQLIDGKRGEASENPKKNTQEIPVSVAMKVYMQLKFLLNKQYPNVLKILPDGSPESANIA